MTSAESLRALLSAVQSGTQTVEGALAALAYLPYEDVGFAKLDHHRGLRKGFPEVVYGQGKTGSQIARALDRLAGPEGVALATRVGDAKAAEVVQTVAAARFEPEARAVVVDRRPGQQLVDGVVVVTAGTSDAAVAAEAVLTAELMGCRAARIADVGVAGIHRLLAQVPVLSQARAIVVVAGMEGALPGVVAGLVSAPVIAVPTSVGYGVHMGGLAPLLTMLNACAPGMAVVNIDNGFGAGYMAAAIARPGESPC